jgi:succinylarginine dihydrolase
LLTRLRQDLGDELCIVTCSSRELSLPEAVAAYPFNSQLLSKPDGKMALVAPSESRERPAARAFLERVLAEATPVDEIVYLDVNASMNNGGGPACLRLRVELSDPERAAVRGRVFLDDTLFEELTRWVELHYRDRLTPSDLADPQFTNEIRTALDELSQLLQLGSIYPFQLAPH